MSDCTAWFWVSQLADRVAYECHTSEVINQKHKMKIKHNSESLDKLALDDMNMLCELLEEPHSSSVCKVNDYTLCNRRRCTLAHWLKSAAKRSVCLIVICLKDACTLCVVKLLLANEYVPRWQKSCEKWTKQITPQQNEFNSSMAERGVVAQWLARLTRNQARVQAPVRSMVCPWIRNVIRIDQNWLVTGTDSSVNCICRSVSFTELK